jgi:meso-butanediol dehydrogenase/(S,S)-butanediol dehydrogenase/diacetyl reductase
MLGELSGKVIALTGGAAGIGRDCATAYVRKGAVVALLDRDGEKPRRPPRN